MAVPSGLVTLLFTDIEGSTRAWEAHPDDMKAALERHDELLRGRIEASGGYVFKTVGDAFCAAFEDAGMALGAATEIQRLLRIEAWPDSTPIRVRMALHSGQCEERDGDYFGPVVNRAARLEAVAHGGQLVLSQLTAELVRDKVPGEVSIRDMGLHRLKDLGRAERVFQVCIAGLACDFPPLRSLDHPGLQHNLPEQISSFVGRDGQVSEVARLLMATRLVTLAGPGGVGKTRMALQVGAESLDGTGDGVWFVDLAPIVEPSLVAATVAKVLWAREEPGRPLIDSVVDAVGDRRLLLVLDNCEQVISAAATLVDALLRRCPHVVVMATSREPLAIAGEQVYRVPSLAVPAADDDLAAVAASEAVRLFLERADQQRPGFSLTEDNAAVIGRLCRRLDGIPFAIELAAARLRSLSVRDIDAHLDKRLRLLTGGSRTALPRQQTLEALIDWSHDLLSINEKAVLARLAIFAGGFGMDAAEAVCPGDDIEDFEVVELLDALVDKSLVQADDSGVSIRFRLLETMREYAGAKLARRDASEQARVAVAHRDYYLALAESAAPHLHGPGEVEWAARLDLELANLRGALTTCLVDPDPAAGLRLGESLGEFWFLRGYGIEGAETLRVHLDRPAAAAPTLLRGRALAAGGRLVEEYVADYPAAVTMAGEALAIAHLEGDDTLAMRAILVVATARNLQGDHEGSLELIDDALPGARRLGDPRHAARMLNARGWALDELGLDSRASYEECAELSRRAGDQRGLAAGVGNLGFLALLAGDLDAARRYNGEALQVFRELGDLRGVAIGSLNSGYATYLDGDGAAARGLFLECLATARRIGARRYVAYAILGLADTATLTGHAERAATLHGAFDALFEQLGAGIEALEARLRDADHARLRALLGDGPFDVAYATGRALALDEVLALAISPAD